MTGSQSRIHRASGRDKVTDTHENRVFVSLFLVCVNLIIQIFIYIHLGHNSISFHFG